MMSDPSRLHFLIIQSLVSEMQYQRKRVGKESCPALRDCYEEYWKGNDEGGNEKSV